MSSEAPQSPKKEAVTRQEILASVFTGKTVTPPAGSDALVDLSTIPRGKWENYLCSEVVLPPDVEKYVAGIKGKETVLEKDYIEERVISFYGVTDPYTILYRNGRARLIRND